MSAAVGINLAEWGDGSPATFAQFVAGTVSHEVAHTFGVGESYDREGKRYAPYDLMMNGSPSDGDLDFYGGNIDYLRGHHLCPSLIPTPQYRRLCDS